MKIHPLQSQSPVIVYIDIKSPYAYLAVEPTRQLEKELGIEFDWRPFVLDIPSYLGSARLDQEGNVVEQDRSAEQWLGVKYAYADCRRYARMHGQTIRGTEKIWDSNLVATAMLWARQHGRQALDSFIDFVYVPFWKRELDIQDMATIEGLLDSCVPGENDFAAWSVNVGMTTNLRLQEEAFNAGIYGVPTYVIDGKLFFGREHLPRVKWELSDKSTAAPDVAYTLPSYAHELPSIDNKNVCIGIDNSLDSLLAISPLMSLLNQHGLSANWVTIKPKSSEQLPSLEDKSREAQHKHHRVRNLEANNLRYSPSIKPQDNNEFTAEIKQELKNHGICLIDHGPEDIINTPLPGVAVKVDGQLFIGRQHLPLISALLDAI